MLSGLWVFHLLFFFVGGGWYLPNRFLLLGFRSGVLVRMGAVTSRWYIVRRVLCGLIIVFIYIFY